MNGVPSCANNWLLGTLLRDAWSFDGAVVSDCDADDTVYSAHHYTATPELAVQAVLRAGTDVDCGNFATQHAQSALNQGVITQDDIDTVLLRQFKLRIRLGHFDPAGPLQTIGTDQLCNAYSIELARDGARQGMVMVKNEAGRLPLGQPSAYARTVVIGPSEDYDGVTWYYGGAPCSWPYTTPAAAIREWLPSASALQGVPSVSSNDTSNITAAAVAAGAADLVILTIGSDLSLEQEGHDRTSIAFSDAQLALIAAVANASATPVIALVFSGGAMDMSPLLSNPKIGAVFWVGQPSVQIAGIGDLLFGRTKDGRQYSPAGRMSQMVYPASIVNEVSMFDFGMRP